MYTLAAILKWLLRLFGGTAQPSAPVSTPEPPRTSPADPVDAFSDATVVARTAWAEARGQGREGMQAVINVIQNRARNPGWWGGPSLRSVCLAKAQFSCWNAGDPQARVIRSPEILDAEYPVADSLALSALAGKLPDLTGGADHYYSETIQRPQWAVGRTATFIAGTAPRRHFFYRIGLGG